MHTPRQSGAARCIWPDKLRTTRQEEGSSELEEVEKELAAQKGKPAVVTAKGKERPASPGSSLISPIFLQAFTLTFLAEWGDRSQVSFLPAISSSS